MAPRKVPLRPILLVVILVLVIFNLCRSTSSGGQLDRLSAKEVFCPPSNLAEDVLVVMRTGATESHAKLPIHFHTTLRCTPHYIIFSDFDETVDGHQIIDVLRDVDEEMKTEHPDFELYNHLRKHGRRGLETKFSLGTQSGTGSGGQLNLKNPGWRLDKWKFLPMVKQALEHRPAAKWFVFIEPDTYLVWPNLLEYLSLFDAKQPHYLGKHMFIVADEDAVEFAYGGAGFVLSNSAMRAVTNHHSDRIAEYDNITAYHWAGDYILGKVLKDVHIPLFRAFPHFQGDPPAILDSKTTKMDPPRGAWCYPAVTFHHMTPHDIEEMWLFEQEWFKKRSGLLRYRDIFRDFIGPKIEIDLQGWDNMSNDEVFSENAHSDQYTRTERDASRSLDDCRAVCQSKSECLQFSYSPKKCSTSKTLKLGYARPGEKVHSGWMMPRIQLMFHRMDETCGVRDWFLPSG